VVNEEESGGLALGEVAVGAPAPAGVCRERRRPKEGIEEPGISICPCRVCVAAGVRVGVSRFKTPYPDFDFGGFSPLPGSGLVPILSFFLN
jgi:hypothetical protein